MYGGQFEGVDEVTVGEFYPEKDDYGYYVYDNTPGKISEVLDEIESLSPPMKEYLYLQLYAGTFTGMEGFLSSKLLKTVL